MSRMYRVCIKETVSISTKSDDRILRDIVLQRILPQEEMTDIFEQRLQEQGFEQEGSLYRKELEGLPLEIDLHAKNSQGSPIIQARLQICVEEDVQIEVDLEGRAYSEAAAAQDARRQIQKLKEDGHSKAQEKLDAQVEERLQKAASQAEEILHSLLQETYAEALKQKAAQIGTVLEQSESTDENGSYELKIRIEI